MEKNNREGEKYNSVVEEMRRHMSVRHKLKTKSVLPEDAFQNFIKTFRVVYQAPNKDFSKIGSSLSINKHNYKIMDFTNTYIKLKNITKEEEYTLEFKAIKPLFKKYCFIKYIEHVKASRTLFGLKASISKWYFKKRIKENKKIILKEMNKINN